MQQHVAHHLTGSLAPLLEILRLVVQAPSPPVAPRRHHCQTNQQKIGCTPHHRKRNPPPVAALDQRVDAKKHSIQKDCFFGKKTDSQETSKHCEASLLKEIEGEQQEDQPRRIIVQFHHMNPRHGWIQQQSGGGEQPGEPIPSHSPRQQISRPRGQADRQRLEQKKAVDRWHQPKHWQPEWHEHIGMTAPQATLHHECRQPSTVQSLMKRVPEKRCVLCVVVEVGIFQVSQATERER